MFVTPVELVCRIIKRYFDCNSSTADRLERHRYDLSSIHNAMPSLSLTHSHSFVSDIRIRGSINNLLLEMVRIPHIWQDSDGLAVELVCSFARNVIRKNPKQGHIAEGLEQVQYIAAAPKVRCRELFTRPSEADTQSTRQLNNYLSVKGVSVHFDEVVQMLLQLVFKLNAKGSLRTWHRVRSSPSRSY